MKNFVKIILSALIIGISSLQGNAQSIKIESIADTNQILIGEQFKLQLKASAPKSGQIIWPALKDTLSKQFDIISKSKIDTLASANPDEITLSQILTLTSFDTGNLVIPEIQVNYINQADSVSSEAFSASSPIYVGSIAVDTTQNFKAITGPIHQSITLQMVLPFILIGILLVGILIALRIYFIRKKQAEPLFKPKLEKVIPPNEIALTKLAELRLAKLWQNGQVKLYYSNLTDIVRVYIEGRYQIQAMELTSDEIMKSIKDKGINETAMQKLKGTLFLADLVKFAKEKPSPMENDSCVENMIDFVNETPFSKETIETPNQENN